MSYSITEEPERKAKCLRALMPSVFEEPEPLSHRAIRPTDGVGKCPVHTTVGVSLSSVNTTRRVVPLGSNFSRTPVSTLEPRPLPPHDDPRQGETVPPQQEQRVERRLAAIFAADVAGYSRLMSQNEAGTLRALAAAREVMDGLIRDHGGRIANTAGDSVLAEFSSAVDAVQCAVEVQEKLAEGTGVREDRRLQFRIGIHVGDVVVRGGDLLGDGVNVAARMEASPSREASRFQARLTAMFVRFFRWPIRT